MPPEDVKARQRRMSWQWIDAELSQPAAPPTRADGAPVEAGIAPLGKVESREPAAKAPSDVTDQTASLAGTSEGLGR